MNSSSRFALLILDLQNDICHPEGVFHKQGLIAPKIKEILHPIGETIHFCRKHRIPILATQLTVVSLHGKVAMGHSMVKKLHPFLEKEGLREGTWGHDLLEGLPPVDFKIKKWGESGFYQTELEHYLQTLHVQKLLLAGFTTNGVVESFAREALGRNYEIYVLSDCVNSYSEVLHQSSLANLSTLGILMTSSQWQNGYTKPLEG